MTVAEDLAQWGASAPLDTVPAEVEHAAARHLMDGLGNALAGRRAGVVDPAVRVAEQLGGPAEATVFGSRTKLSAPAAALANGVLTHGLDFDDTHAGGLVHATTVVLPAAFAVGEQLGSSGQDVMRAALVGYEVVCRVAGASPHGFHAKGMHATQVAGVFSSAAVTARLLGLDAAVTAQALGIAGSSSGGLLEFLSTGASTKQLHPGSASMNGVLAARLAAEGATGPVTVLEGPYGVYATMSAREADLDSITRDLGTSWEVTQITIKPYPSCQLMHVTLDAATAARTQLGAVSPELLGQITEVVAYVHPDSASIVCEPADVKVAPRTSYDGKFSLPWSVAALLTDGSVGVNTYALDSLERPAVRELSAKVRTVVEDPGGVAADAAGRVEVHFADGSTIVGEVPCSIGGPNRPLDDTALLGKFLLNTGDSAAARELADRVIHLSAEPNLTGIVDLVARTHEG